MAKVYKTPGTTPGVYIEEKNAFPNSVVPVATDIPAFIGYTENASRGKVSLTNVPTRITSFAEYLLLFGAGPKTTFDIKVDKLDYKLEPKTQRFLLYNSLRLFFANGGSSCYIVSIGSYDQTIAVNDFLGEQINGRKSFIGINTLLKEAEPTMLVIPDAMLLEEADCAKLQRQMIQHCGSDMGNRIAILDVFNGFKKRSPADDIIEKFRSGVGNDFLDFAAAYYPWLDATVVGPEEVDFMNIDSATRSNFINLLKARNAQLVKEGSLDQARASLNNAEIDKISTDVSAAKTAPKAENVMAVKKDVKVLHQALLAMSPLYKEVMHTIREQLNLLPPSAAIAGIYSQIDNSFGVWKSPASVGINSVIKPSVNLTNDEQEDLNVPLSGKAVNAIRTFPGKGVLVWGARTLDGNSQDWRYISVRRTVIYIEQSLKYAAEAYVFEPNVTSTWTNLKASITNFLTNTWRQGALAGATAQDAFSVDVGLGTTMTSVDVLNGSMRISVKIAVTRPAEFIVITFEQQVQKS